MDPRPHEYILEVFSDQTFVKDIVKGVLHTLFFHRYFPSVRPSLFTPAPTSTSTSMSSTSSISTLPIPLPCILDPPEIDSLIESRVQALIHALTSADKAGGGGGARAEIAVQFFDRKRRKTNTGGGAGGWLGRLGGVGTMADEEVCWEEWCIEVVVARPRTEADRIKVRRAMESSLQKTAMKIVAIVNKDRDHIPPITTSDANPFPYRIVVNPKEEQKREERFGGVGGKGYERGGYGGWS